MRRRAVGIVVALALAVGFWLVLGPARATRMPRSFSDIAYGAASPAQRLDIYLPAGVHAPYPAVVFIHGGGFRIGDKHDSTPAFAARVKRVNDAGMAFVSINYRMSDEARFPAAVIDARSAVRWLRAHGDRYGIDPKRIAAWGQSAGANLAMMVGLTDRIAGFDDPRIAPGVSSRVSAVVSMYGPTDFLRMDEQLRASPCGAKAAVREAPGSPESRYIGAALRSAPRKAAAASPISYVRRGAPPMLLQAGTADCVVPAAQSVIMDKALRRTGSSSRLMLLPDARHSDPRFEAPANLDAVVAFLQQAFSRPAR